MTTLLLCGGAVILGWWGRGKVDDAIHGDRKELENGRD